MRKLLNLAGKPANDRFIEEMTRCGIEVFPRTGEQGVEVKLDVEGRLKGLVISRAWNYFTVVGLVPIEVARKLYETPVGKTDIRSGGDCGCRPPDTWAKAYDMDKKLPILPQKEWDDAFEKYPDSGVTRLLTKERDKTFIVGDPDDYPKFVDCYHIDSELGLYIFARKIAS